MKLNQTQMERFLDEIATYMDEMTESQETLFIQQVMTIIKNTHVEKEDK